MARFFFHLCQHSEAGRRSLEDPIMILMHQLRELGHFVLWDEENDRKPYPEFAIGEDAYNVVVEGFTPQITAHLAAVHAQGARFICLATEEPTERGFNHGTQREMIERQRDFPEAMRYFEGILHLVPGERVTRWYSQHAPAAYAELGYSRGMLRADAVPNPEYLFGFYGSLTPRRHALLKRLARTTGVAKAVRLVTDFATGAERDAAMQNCRVILQVRKFDEMGLVSSSRCATSLFLGRPVIAEAHDVALSKPWDEIVRFTRDEASFFLEAKLMLNRWREAHREQLARFARTLTPEVCVGRPLAQILAQPRQAAA